MRWQGCYPTFNTPFPALQYYPSSRNFGSTYDSDEEGADGSDDEGKPKKKKFGGSGGDGEDGEGKKLSRKAQMAKEKQKANRDLQQIDNVGGRVGESV